LGFDKQWTIMFYFNDSIETYILYYKAYMVVGWL
jgi:hypothetical protein